MQGLIYSYLLDGKGGGRHMDWARMHETDSNSIRWMHLDYSDERVRQWLYNESGLDEVVCRALMDEDIRPRLKQFEDGTLLVLRGVNFNPGADPEDMVAIRIWIEGKRVITMRHRKVMAVEDIANSIKAGKGPRDISDFVESLCRLITWRISEVVGDIVDKADLLEESLLEMGSGELRKELAMLRRQAIALRRYIAPQREVLSRLYTLHAQWQDKEFRTMVHEHQEATLRLLEDLDAARERAAITQEELNNSNNEKMNRIMYTLTLVAALFLPLGFLTGLLGINVGGIPGTEDKEAFIIVCSILAIIAVIQIAYFRMKRFL